MSMKSHLVSCRIYNIQYTVQSFIASRGTIHINSNDKPETFKNELEKNVCARRRNKFLKIVFPSVLTFF